METLPQNWACRITKESRETLIKWAISQSSYNNSFSRFLDGCFVVSKHPLDNSYQYNCELKGGNNANYFTEITFDDFKRLVLKEDPVKDLIEEAKRRYTIGTEFYSALKHDINPAKCICNGGYIFEKSTNGCKNVIWALDHNYSKRGFLYHDGNWAEIIKEENMCTEKTIKLSLEQARKMYGKNSEMDELLLANFSKEELTKKNLPESFSELKQIDGFFIESLAYVSKPVKNYQSVSTNKNIFATEKQARSALAMAQLSQLMAVYNDGWEFNPDGNFKNTSKAYVIIRRHNEIKPDYFENNWAFLAFKSAEIRDEFLKNFEPLIKEYFMID